MGRAGQGGKEVGEWKQSLYPIIYVWEIEYIYHALSLRGMGRDGEV